MRAFVSPEAERDRLKTITLRKTESKLASVNVVFRVASSTLIGAVAVSVLQEHQSLLIALGVASLLLCLQRRGRAMGAVATLERAFLLLAVGVSSYQAELWGTTKGYWAYAHVQDGATVPLWVPLAWMHASVLLHNMSAQLNWNGRMQGSGPRVWFLFAMAFPFLGESICVASGVWVYNWPFKVIGVPVFVPVLWAGSHVVLFALHERASCVLRGCLSRKTILVGD